MNGKPRRRRSYIASKRPDFNASEETWADYLKVSKCDPEGMKIVRALLLVMRRRIPASAK